MNIAKLLKDIELPAVYQREGKDCYYDTYRKKLIEITPEETVRQKVAALFEQKYGVPKDMISLEVPLTHYATGVAGRADIVIHEPSEDGKTKYPVTIIECKNEEILLTDKVVDQAIRYCDVLGGNYIAITNGLELRFAAYDEELNSYVFLDEILSFDQMVNKEYILPEMKEEELLRFTLEELNNQELILEYNNADTWIFGADTDDRLRSFAINLYQAFIDTTHKLPLIKRNCFELVAPAVVPAAGLGIAVAEVITMLQDAMRWEDIYPYLNQMTNNSKRFRITTYYYEWISGSGNHTGYYVEEEYAVI